jgi:hypothetical protein
MIEKLPEGDFQVICDGNCGTEKEYFADGNWNNLMKQMIKDKWKSRQKDGQWLNFCKQCS